MKYNRENYEASALDYLENNLSAEDRAEFDVFLLLNPDIQESISEFELIEIPALSGVLHPDKKALLKDEGNGRIIFFNRNIISLAAAILLLLLAVVFLLPKSTVPTTEIATSAEPKSVIEEGSIELEEINVESPHLVEQEEMIQTEASKSLAAVSNQQKAQTTKEPQPTPEKTSTIDEFVASSNLIEPSYQVIEEAPEDNLPVPLEELLKVDERVVYQVAKIEQNSVSALEAKKYELQEPDFPILVIDEEELLGKEPSKFKRFLAKANLIPSDYTSDDYDSFKQNLLPESIPGLK